MPWTQQPQSSKRVTIADVAKVAGVSRSTASRALTGNGYAAEDVRRRVQEAARQLRYVPDANARQLRQQTSKTVGVIVSHLSNSFYAELAAGVDQAARDCGYVMMLAEDDDMQTAAKAMLEMRVAGVIITPSSNATTDVLLEHDIPVVEVDRTFASGHCDSVALDNYVSARNATKDLIDKGHRRIVLLIDETDWTTGRDRLAGFRAAYADAGLAFESNNVVEAGWSMEEARSVVTKLLRGKNRPTAIFAANNVLAEGAYRAIQDNKKSIPHDISLICFDDSPWMSMVEPGISAIAQDASALGSVAMQRLISRIQNASQPFQNIVLSAQIKSRGSVADLTR